MYLANHYFTKQLQLSENFGLDSIADLPKLRELEEIADQSLKVSESPRKSFNITQEDVEKLGKVYLRLVWKI